MQRTPTLRDVATLAGVAPSVVSRLLNGDPTLKIRDETRTRILSAREELGYTPNAAAQSLRSPRGHAVAVIAHGIVSPVYAGIIRGCQIAASRRGHGLFVGEAEEINAAPERLLGLLRGDLIDGLILQGLGTKADQSLRESVVGKTPLVVLQDEPAEGYATVCLPDRQAGRLATSHLADLGHRNIACITTARGTRHARDRSTGWRQEMHTRGLEAPNGRLGWAGSSPADGYAAFSRLLKKGERPTAVVVSNAMAAIGVMAAAQDAGIVIPRDLSVVAIHDLELADFLRPALTTVRMPLEALGQRAVELVLGGDVGGEVIINSPAPELVVRGSTGPAFGL